VSNYNRTVGRVRSADGVTATRGDSGAARLLPFILAVFLILVALVGVLPTPARADAAVALGFNSATLTSHPLGSLRQFDRESGTNAKIAMYYQDWNPNWSTALLNPKIVDPIYASGAVPMISWTPFRSSGNPRRQPAYQLRRIVAGAFDPYLRRAALEAASSGRPVLVNLAPEMNGSWFNYGAGINGNTPQLYKAMWRHVVSIFREAGAENVRWVWSPNVYGNGRIRPFAPFYPGDEWVDVVGLDGYNWGHSWKTAWEGFDHIFQPSYAAMERLTRKPLIISETACAERGGNKASWITNMGRLLLTRMPRVRAIVWFNRVKERDWKISSSPYAEAAFRRLVAARLFDGTIDPLLASP
jgi:mannan endo-1,4-beta-mannosidase